MQCDQREVKVGRGVGDRDGEPNGECKCGDTGEDGDTSDPVGDRVHGFAVEERAIDEGHACGSRDDKATIGCKVEGA